MNKIRGRFGVMPLMLLGLVVHGCGGSSAELAACPTANTCTEGQAACTRGCGRGQQMICECGTGQLAGMLLCGTCMNAATGGNTGSSTGGRTGTGGRVGAGGRAGTGGATGAGGRAGTGGRGMAATGGRGMPGTGGATTVVDAGVPVTGACPAGLQSGTTSCTPTATPSCKTDCVNGMNMTCTCASIGQGVGVWSCPASQVACP